MRVHRRLTAAAEEWCRLDRDEDALYRGTPPHRGARVARQPPPDAEPTSSASSSMRAGARRQRDASGAPPAHRGRVRRPRRARWPRSASWPSSRSTRVGRPSKQRDIAVSRELALQSAKEARRRSRAGVRLALLALDKSRDRRRPRRRCVKRHWPSASVAAFRADSVTADTASPTAQTVVAWSPAARAGSGRCGMSDAVAESLGLPPIMVQC